MFATPMKKFEKMRKLALILVMACCILQQHLASAQSAEVQQLALNVEKLAQLKQILADMKKGYAIASQGYGKIKDIAEGNFSLHQTFLDGLMAVSPHVRKYKRVADIIIYQHQIIREYKAASNRFGSGRRLSANELEYMTGFYWNLLDRSIQNLDELTMIVTSGKLRMSDDERLEAIDRLYFDMQDKLLVLRRFTQRVAAVDGRREQAQKNAEIMKALQGQRE